MTEPPDDFIRDRAIKPFFPLCCAPESSSEDSSALSLLRNTSTYWEVLEVGHPVPQNLYLSTPFVSPLGR